MGVLDQVTQMRDQGVGDEEIVRKLQESGVSPKEINDALSQAEIKKAVSGEESNEGYEGNQEIPSPSPTGGEYIPQAQEEVYEESGGNYTPQPQVQPQQQEYDEYYPQQGYDPNSYGGTYEEGGYQTGTDSNTIMEISEQVFSEKIQKIQKQVKELTEFKSLMGSKVEIISDRLKRIESIIDKLQVAILDKIGSYGRNLDNIKKEMSMMQDSFGKVLPSLASKHHTQHITHKETKKQEHKKTTKHKTIKGKNSSRKK